MHSIIMTMEVIALASTGVGLTMLAAMEPPDGVLYAACLAGSVGGAFCSLRIKPAESQAALINLVASNVVFGMLIGPLAVGQVATWSKLSPDFPLAVAVSGVMSGVISLVAWVAIPQLLRWAIGADWVAIVGERFGLKRTEKPPADV